MRVLEETGMFRWLWRCLRLSSAKTPRNSHYDSVYGLPQKAIDAWLAVNPKLAAEHRVLEARNKDRHDRAAGLSHGSTRAGKPDTVH